MTIWDENECRHTKVTKWLYMLDKGKFDVKYINEYYKYTKDDKNFVRVIGSDYRNNEYLRKEYKKNVIVTICKFEIVSISNLSKKIKYALCE